MIWRRLRTLVILILLAAAGITLIVPEWPAFGDKKVQMRGIVGREQEFDFLSWTAETLGNKAQAVFAGTHYFLPESAEKEFVLAYLEQLGEVLRIEADIERAFADPTNVDPESATAELRMRRDALREELAKRRPLAEAIVQRQVAAVLADEGLSLGGMAFPPVLMTMSPVPYMLIVSPRDEIAQVSSAALVPGLSTEDKEALEERVLNELDQSGLVVPIGGLGTYPAMIRETANMNWLAEVTAHEWAHHWLSLRPLGVRYLDSPAMRTINETVASQVDLEIGPKVIERFYPELVPQPAPAAPPAGAAPSQPPALDFSAAMAETRATVDRLLADGQIEGAEKFMEQRRQLFLQNGYNIRKMNQAYFAFYGGYAAVPGGAAGQDPIGPLLRELRAASPSLRQYLIDVGGVRSFEDLVALHGARVGVAATPQGE